MRSNKDFIFKLAQESSTKAVNWEIDTFKELADALGTVNSLKEAKAKRKAVNKTINARSVHVVDAILKTHEKSRKEVIKDVNKAFNAITTK